MKKYKILFVCHGNICRSPMAEFIFKNIVKNAGRTEEFEISSLATSTEEIGHDMYTPAKKCLEKHGIPFTRHTARQITIEDYCYFDYIFAMDRNNLRWLKMLGIEDKSKKIQLIMNLIGEDRDVDDPWYTNNFERTYLDLSNALPKILKLK